MRRASPCPTTWDISPRVDLTLRSLRQERPLLAQLVRTGTEQECALRVGIDPFTKPSANGRYLRVPAEDRSRRSVFCDGSTGSSSGCRGLPVFSALALGSFLRREAEVTTKVLSSSPISSGAPAKGNSSVEGGLVRASELPSGEAPTPLIGQGVVRSWATASLYGHAPETQVSRWGLPLITNIFMRDRVMREDFNRSTPVQDIPCFSAQIASVAVRLTRLAGSAAEPDDYARRLIERLCPVTTTVEASKSGVPRLRTRRRSVVADWQHQTTGWLAAQVGAPLTAQPIRIEAIEVGNDRQNRGVERQPSGVPPSVASPALSWLACASCRLRRLRRLLLGPAAVHRVTLPYGTISRVSRDARDPID